MARGQKTSPEVIYQVMTSWLFTGNYSQTAREVGLPISTVTDIVTKNKDNEEFVKLRDEKVKEFADKASVIIDKGLVLLNRRLNRALEEEEALDELIDEIYSTDDKDMSQQAKTAAVNKIKHMQLQNLKDVTTAIGTLYDKRALSRGESTQNVDFATNFNIDKLAEIAGYSKKDDDK